MLQLSHFDHLTISDSAREQFRKSVREHFASARERLEKILPVNPKSAREQTKKCP